jgi:hypothetical protein
MVFNAMVPDKTVGKNAIIEKTTPMSIEKSPYLQLRMPEQG